MKLMTKGIERRLIKYPCCPDKENEMGSEVIVKYFNPYVEGTLLIT